MKKLLEVLLGIGFWSGILYMFCHTWLEATANGCLLP
jgi:hypothetical protein